MHIAAAIGNIIEHNLASGIQQATDTLRPRWRIIGANIKVGYRRGLLQFNLSRQLAILLIAFSILLVISPPDYGSENEPHITSDDWKMVWSDEFNEPDHRLAPSKWQREEGFLRNEELQYYTQNEKNLRIANGNLLITARKETVANKDYWPEAPPHSKWVMTRPTAEFTSASISSEDRFEFTFGRIDIRARLPQGKGIWPAFWLIGSSAKEIGWPACGEIDIMEHIGREPRSIHASIHYKGQKELPVRKSAEIQVDALSTQFHIYSMIWDKYEIKIRIDNQPYFSILLDHNLGFYKDRNPFRAPFFIKINLALGGKWSGPVDEENLPQSMAIDYVRVYKNTGERSAASKEQNQ